MPELLCSVLSGLLHRFHLYDRGVRGGKGMKERQTPRVAQRARGVD